MTANKFHGRRSEKFCTRLITLVQLNRWKILTRALALAAAAIHLEVDVLPVPKLPENIPEILLHPRAQTSPCLSVESSPTDERCFRLRYVEQFSDVQRSFRFRQFFLNDQASKQTVARIGFAVHTFKTTCEKHDIQPVTVSQSRNGQLNE